MRPAPAVADPRTAFHEAQSADRTPSPWTSPIHKVASRFNRYRFGRRHSQRREPEIRAAASPYAEFDRQVVGAISASSGITNPKHAPQRPREHANGRRSGCAYRRIAYVEKRTIAGPNPGIPPAKLKNKRRTRVWAALSYSWAILPGEIQYLRSASATRMPARMLFCAAVVLLFLIQAARADPPTDPVGAGRIRYAPLLNSAAAQYSLPPALADAVATGESAYDSGAQGAVGEVGLMQVRPSTAEMLGFRGSLEQLADPATNSG